MSKVSLSMPLPFRTDLRVSYDPQGDKLSGEEIEGRTSVALGVRILSTESEKEKIPPKEL
jgi:hypothetical protein